MRNEINVLVENINYNNIDLSLAAKALNNYEIEEFQLFCDDVDEHAMTMTKTTFESAKELLSKLDSELERQSGSLRHNITRELESQFPKYEIEIVNYSHDPMSQIQIDSEFSDYSDEEYCYAEQELMRSVNCIVDDAAELIDFSLIHELREQIENLCDQAEGE